MSDCASGGGRAAGSLESVSMLDKVSLVEVTKGNQDGEAGDGGREDLAGPQNGPALEFTPRLFSQVPSDF